MKAVAWAMIPGTLLLCGLTRVVSAPRVHATAANAAPIEYDKQGHAVLPPNYREWIFLSSGLDMVYGPKAAMKMDHSMFDNVFVDPAAYRSFLATGHWPEQTAFVLEIRKGESNASINHGGQSQGAEVMGMELHVRDTTRFPSGDGWRFYDVGDDGKGALLPESATCYSCHQQHGAVDTTFVQFYPTLLTVAKARGTLTEAYLKESTATQGPRAPSAK